MPWTTPSYVELNMSAEIGAYQDDLERRDGPRPEAAARPAERHEAAGDPAAVPSVS